MGLLRRHPDDERVGSSFGAQPEEGSEPVARPSESFDDETDWPDRPRPVETESSSERRAMGTPWRPTEPGPALAPDAARTVQEPDHPGSVPQGPATDPRRAYAPAPGYASTEPRTERTAAVPGRTVDETTEVVITRWSWADLVVALLGAGLVVIGAIALARTEIDGSWYRPIVDVLDARHTALLGALEVGAGALIVLFALTRLRALAALTGLALAGAAAFAAIETSEVRRELAIEDWWAWTLMAVGLVVVLLELKPRRGRVERVTETA